MTTLTAKAFVKKNADYYNMAHEKRRVAIVFMHTQFDNSELKPRSREDGNHLAHLLSKLNFHVLVRVNLSLEEIKDCISETARENHCNTSCLFIAVTTYCTRTAAGNISRLYASDENYDPNILLADFNGKKCKQLAGKPKLFFVLASAVNDHTQTDWPTYCDSSIQYTIPTQADFLIVFSVLPDNLKLVQALSDALICHTLNGKKTDFLSILTSVLNKVDHVHDTPNITSFLTRRILL